MGACSRSGTIRSRPLHIRHRHHAIGAAAAHARQIDLELARERAHRRHRLHSADADRGLRVHRVGSLHRADHGAAVGALVARVGLVFRRGAAIAFYRATFGRGDHAVVRRRILRAHTLARGPGAVVVPGVLAFEIGRAHV